MMATALEADLWPELWAAVAAAWWVLLWIFVCLTVAAVSTPHGGCQGI